MKTLSHFRTFCCLTTLVALPVITITYAALGHIKEQRAAQVSQQLPAETRAHAQANTATQPAIPLAPPANQSIYTGLTQLSRR